jgi:hypothetical protein
MQYSSMQHDIAINTAAQAAYPQRHTLEDMQHTSTCSTQAHATHPHMQHSIMQHVINTAAPEA